MVEQGKRKDGDAAGDEHEAARPDVLDDRKGEAPGAADHQHRGADHRELPRRRALAADQQFTDRDPDQALRDGRKRAQYSLGLIRSEEHTSELQSLIRSSYAVLFLKK